MLEDRIPPPSFFFKIECTEKKKSRSHPLPAPRRDCPFDAGHPGASLAEDGVRLLPEEGGRPHAAPRVNCRSKERSFLLASRVRNIICSLKSLSMVSLLVSRVCVSMPLTCFSLFFALLSKISGRERLGETCSLPKPNNKSFHRAHSLYSPSGRMSSGQWLLEQGHRILKEGISRVRSMPDKCPPPTPNFSAYRRKTNRGPTYRNACV